MDREKFERLNSEEQERVFHQLPFCERGELLIHSHHPARLTGSLSPEELYLMTREMDLEEQSEIMRYATLPQLFFISDIDCWRKDRLDPEGCLIWLETLQKADEERLLAWLVEMDYETVVSAFKTLIEVVKPETEYPPDEILGDQPFFTLDERYFILVKEENIETVRRAIELLFENHPGRYAAVLEGILGELDYELEEEALQNRTSRLAERGFPDGEAAHQIYRPLTREELERFPKKREFLKGVFDQEKGRAPHYLALWGKDRLFLDEVLLLFREGPAQIREGLEEELAWLSNKIISSEGIDFASEEKVRQGIERARRFVSIGLELLSGRDLLQARQVITERWLEHVFRLAVRRLYELREPAEKVVSTHWAGSREAFLAFLSGPPYEPIFRGLLQSLPECFDPEVTDHPDELRDFKDLRDLERTRQAVEQIARIHELLRVRLGDSDLSLFPLLGTSFAAFALSGKLRSGSLTHEEAARFLGRGFENGSSRRVLNQELKEGFLNESFSEEDRALLRPLWSLVFNRLEEELGALEAAREIDSRFVSSLYLASKKGRKVHHADTRS